MHHSGVFTGSPLLLLTSPLNSTYEMVARLYGKFNLQFRSKRQNPEWNAIKSRFNQTCSAYFSFSFQTILHKSQGELLFWLRCKSNRARESKVNRSFSAEKKLWSFTENIKTESSQKGYLCLCPLVSSLCDVTQSGEKLFCSLRSDT